MRRFLLGLLFLNLLGAVLGAVLTWPKSAADPERTSPTLAEFQTGVRIAVVSDATTQSSDAPAARSERMQRGDTRVASNQSLQEMLSAAEFVPEASLPRLASPHATADVRRQEARPTDAVLTPAVMNAPEPSPSVPATPIAIGETPRQDDLSADTPEIAVEVEKPRAQTSIDQGTKGFHQTLSTGRHVDHISIHYHGDTRSRADAQRISSRLGSAGPGSVEMHATAHISPASLVRYFSRQDAAAATSLAKELRSRATDWHVDDCTAYQHKPARGTIQLWPAALAASR